MTRVLRRLDQERRPGLSLHHARVLWCDSGRYVSWEEGDWVLRRNEESVALCRDGRDSVVAGTRVWTRRLRWKVVTPLVPPEVAALRSCAQLTRVKECVADSHPLRAQSTTMSPDPLSPTPLPGSFPRSPPTSPRTLNPRTLPPPSPQTSLSSIQGRRSGISTGLGVCFAPSSPPIPLSPLPPRPHAHFSTTSISRSASRSAHSRRSSITSTAPSTIDHGATPTASRRPSRRPSLSHLASFLSGIEHHTRVRNPGMSGGRGVSRSASRSQSRAGEGRHDSRSSSRRSSIGAHLGKLVRENTSGSGSGGELGDEGWTGEEPFLDTAPSSPRPKRTQTHDSYGGSGLEDVDVFDEGDRVGVGVWLEGRGGWARDCFEDTAEGMGSGVGELEVVRRLGEGTYAM